MFTKMKNWWNELDRKIEINKRELVLELAVCALAGFGLGMLLSPRKQVTIGSHNGNNNSGSLSAVDGSEGSEAEDEAEAAEQED